MPLYGVSGSKTALNRPQTFQHEVTQVLRWKPTGELKVRTKCGRQIDFVCIEVEHQKVVLCGGCAKASKPMVVTILHQPPGWNVRVREYVDRQIDLSKHGEPNEDFTKRWHRERAEQAAAEAEAALRATNPPLF